MNFSKRKKKILLTDNHHNDKLSYSGPSLVIVPLCYRSRVSTGLSITTSRLAQITYCMLSINRYLYCRFGPYKIFGRLSVIALNSSVILQARKHTSTHTNIHTHKHTYTNPYMLIHNMHNCMVNIFYLQSNSVME